MKFSYFLTTLVGLVIFVIPEYSISLSDDIYDIKTNYETYTKVSASQRSNMGSMQIFDQGDQSSCVTQAIAAVINVLHYNRSNYVSTKCSLNLGNFLSKQDQSYFKNNTNKHVRNIYAHNKAIGRDTYPSGWEGSYPFVVVSQIAAYGIIPKAREYMCGLPKTDFISVEKSTILAQYPLDEINWSIICDNGIYNKSCEINSISAIKKKLDNKSLVVLGIIVTNQDLQYKYYEKDRLGIEPNVWAYTKEVKNCLDKKIAKCKDEPIRGGHAVVAYGYRENPRNPEQGIFYIHNSWGKFSGDDGDYYITYKYLTKMLTSAISFSRGNHKTNKE
jgi:hypothetical protein